MYSPKNNTADCGVSEVTIKVTLDGKGIGEISDGRGGMKYGKNKEIKFKEIEFKFHPGSKIEFLLTTTEIGPKIQKLSKYGVAIKFKTFQIVECSSKCD